MEATEKSSRMVGKMIEEQQIEPAKSLHTYGDGSRKGFFKRPEVVILLIFLCIAVLDLLMVVMAKVSPHTIDVNLESTRATVSLGLGLTVPFHLSSLSVSQILSTYFLIFITVIIFVLV